MTPEAVALAERLVAVLGGRGSERLDVLLWTQRPIAETLPDLDHPSNEGHLRVLAEEVCGEPMTLDPGATGWHLEGETVWGKGPTPGQAYAAAIVAHYEGERA